MAYPHDLTGTYLGGYYLERLAGSGASAKVYLARDGAGQPVALKLLDVGADLGQRSGDARQRLRAEAKALQRLRISGIAQVIDLELEGSEPFLVTEYVAGPTLEEDVRRNGAWRVEETLELGEMLADTLAAVHARGVAHRDIKPANVILGDEGPVLIDFGIALSSGDPHLTKTGLVVGTPGFISPEAISGHSDDQRDDWWSLAALLLFVSTGRAPFGSGTPSVQISRVLAGIADVDGLSPVLQDVFRSVLTPISAGRGQISALFAVLRDRGSQLPNPGSDSGCAVLADSTRILDESDIPATVVSEPVIVDMGDAESQIEGSPVVQAAPGNGGKPKPVFLLGAVMSLCWALWSSWDAVSAGAAAILGLWIGSVIGWHWKSDRRFLSIPGAVFKGTFTSLPGVIILVLAMVLSWRSGVENLLDVRDYLGVGDAGLYTEFLFDGRNQIFDVPVLYWFRSVVALLGLLLALWIPPSAPARLGARRLVRGLLPRWWMRAAAVTVFLGLALSALVLS